MRKTETRVLDCTLNLNEQLERGVQLAHIDERIEGEEDSAKVLAKRAKEVIAELREQKRRYRTAVATGIEPRDVECIWHADWQGKQMTLVRTDTGEVVESRNMTRDEVQLQFTDVDVPQQEARA